MLQVFRSYLAFCGIGMHNAQMYEQLMLENRRNQVQYAADALSHY